MAKISGRRVKLGVGRESTRGTGVSPAFVMPHTSLAVVSKTEEARSVAAMGVLADTDDKLVTDKYAEGDVEGEVRDRSFGYFLYALLGACSSVANGAGYTHSFSLSNSNQHQSLSLFAIDSVQSEQFKMAMLDNLELSCELGGLVNFKAGFISKVGVNTTHSANVVAENKFSKKHVKVKVATDLASLDAATALELKSFTLTFAKNVERDGVLGSGEPVDILNKTFSIEGELSLNYEDQTFRNYMLGGNKKAVRIDIENTDVDLGSGLHPRLRIELPSVDFSEFDIDRSLEDIVKQTIKIKANYDVTNNIISTCSLINAKANYTT